MQIDWFQAMVKLYQPGFRYGQSLMIQLEIHRNDLYQKIKGTNLDSYFNESRVSNAINFIKENW